MFNLKLPPKNIAVRIILHNYFKKVKRGWTELGNTKQVGLSGGGGVTLLSREHRLQLILWKGFKLLINTQHKYIHIHTYCTYFSAAKYTLYTVQCAVHILVIWLSLSWFLYIYVKNGKFTQFMRFSFDQKSIFTDKYKQRSNRYIKRIKW